MSEHNHLHKHVQSLDKGDEAAKRQALHSLKELKQEDWAGVPTPVLDSVVASLQHQLQNGAKPPLVHKEIAAILGNIGQRSKSAVPQLIELLHEGIPDSVRETAAMALGNVGGKARDAVDPLLALCESHTSLAVHAVRALGGIGCADQRVRTTLVNLWQSAFPTQNGQVQIAIALCKLRINAQGLLEFLTKNLVSGQDDGLRKSAAQALAWCNKNDPDVVPALLTATLGDKNEDVRQVAQGALDQLQLSHADAVKLCAKQLPDSALAETALKKSGALAIPALIAALGKEEPVTRLKAARTLGALGELAVAAVASLTKTLQEKDFEIRLAAAKALWNITKTADAVVPALVDLLEERGATDGDTEARRRFQQTVIEALCRIGPAAKAAVPALTHKAKDKNRLVSESARNALKKIAAPAAS
ncbi:MAG: HEAT repeat domain-containing protein [Gemmataceae bacterium]|nr:HEAT repeat domain-containing protein [Gemmataceae bacterium]MCI0739316.1 HEAT repeat domain-containing protein [Gemmataceae bacterium]